MLSGRFQRYSAASIDTKVHVCDVCSVFVSVCDSTLTCHKQRNACLVPVLIACITSGSVPHHSAVMGREVRVLPCCSDGSINLGVEGLAATYSIFLSLH